jgi:superfamily II DNA or RNA helicase
VLFRSTNYEQASKLSGHFDLLILDEAHSFGTYPKTSLRWKNVRNLEYYKVLFLSGTPSPEDFSQIYHQFQLAKNYSPFRNYSTFYKWANDYVNVKQIMIAGNKINDYSNAIIEKVEKAIEPYLITFTQTEAGFETQITETIHYVQMQPITYQLCTKLKYDNVIVGKEQTILADTPVKLLSKLHQLYSGTIKFEDETAKTIDTSKVQFIRDYFKGKKIAIFYKFKQELEMIKQYFTITDSPEEFNSNDNLTFAGQFVSSREGVNLSSADCLVMLNIDFSALSYLQARDRMTTKDRVKENAVHWIFAEKGIEKDIYKTVKNKENFTTQHYVRITTPK